MPRTNEDGRGLQAVLSYMKDKAVPATEISNALHISQSTYYTRIKEDDFPNAEECRLAAEFFGLNPVELMLDFGLVSEAAVRAVLDPPLAARSITTLPDRLHKMRRRRSVPAL